MTLKLEAADRAKLDSAEGPAMKLAMQLVAKAADILGAARDPRPSFWFHLTSILRLERPLPRCFTASAAL
ncbi:MAG: hypothetical protein ACKVP5_09055 [Aestuariivirga sp.]